MGNMKKTSMGLLVSGFSLIIMGCNAWGSYDNPVDPGATNYQGHVTATTFEEAAQALAAVSGTSISNIVLPELLRATEYEVRIVSDADNTETTVVQSITGSGYEITLPQLYLLGKRYYYQFRAKKDDAFSPWSETATFDITPYAPESPSPSDGGSTTDTTPTLSWIARTGETAWVIQTATEIVALDEAIPATLTPQTYTVATPLALGSTFYWRVAPKTDSGFRGWSKVYSLTISTWAYSLSPTPSDAAIISDTTPLLDWNDITNASSYELQVANTEASLGDSELISVTESSYQVSTGLEFGTWYWRVRAKNVDGVTGPWGPILSFVISWPYTLTPIPADAGTTIDTTPLLDWNDVTGASGYEVQIADTRTGVAGSPLIATANSEYQVTTVLANSAVKYWRMRAKNADGITGSWSSIYSFAVSAAKPVLAVPVDLATIIDTTPYFDWSDVVGSTGYRIQVSAESTLATPLADIDTLTASNYTLTAVLSDNTSYWWHVAARNADGVWSDFSQAYKFSIDLNPALNPIAIPGEGQISLSWTNPTTIDFDSIEITWAPTGGSPTQPVIVSKPGISQLITGLANGTSYTFMIKVTDPGGNKSNGVAVFARTSTVIYAGGNSSNSSGILVPGYWKNGTWIGLPQLSPLKWAKVKSLVVSGNDVYAGGYSINSMDVWVPGYWKNGDWFELPRMTSSTGSVLSLAVSGSDVYGGGYIVDDSGLLAIPGYWKNGTWVGLPKISSAGSDYVYSLAVSGGDVYAGGINFGFPGYWKNGTWVGLSQTSGMVTSLFIDGDDIYAGGSQFEEAVGGVTGYWKNTIWTPLPKPEPSIGQVSQSYVRSIFISESDVYAAGWNDGSPNGYSPCYWENGVLVQLPKISVSDVSSAMSIVVSDGNVYVGGSRPDSSGVEEPGYWKNGTWVGLPRLLIAGYGNVSSLVVQ